MSAVMTREYTKYDLNFVRSAMAPETMVAAVAAKAAWKKKVVDVNRPSPPVESMPSTLKPPQPKKPPSRPLAAKAMPLQKMKNARTEASKATSNLIMMMLTVLAFDSTCAGLREHV